MPKVTNIDNAEMDDNQADTESAGATAGLGTL